MINRILATSCMALVLSGSAVLGDDTPARPSSCAFVRSIDYWKPIDRLHAYIYTSPRRKFLVTFFAPCYELKWAIFARIETRPRGAVCLTAGDTLIFGRGVPPFSRSRFDNRFGYEERCMITAIEPVPYEQKEPTPARPAEAPPSY